MKDHVITCIASYFLRHCTYSKAWLIIAKAIRDFHLLSEDVELPANEGVIVRIHVCCHKRSAPVNSTTHGCDVVDGYGRKVVQPVLWFTAQDASVEADNDSARGSQSHGMPKASFQPPIWLRNT